jgi:AhpD family alkylhydroperoxidase
MQPRIPNIAGSHPDVLRALSALSQAAQNDHVPQTTVYLLTLRASQINGCSVCVELHAREMRAAGESDERIFAVSAWRDAPYYTEAERAALALAEAATRMSDRSDPVPDDVWQEASRHYDERALASLVISIAAINAWNRLNVTTRQPAGAWTQSPRADTAASPSAQSREPAGSAV